MNDIEPLQEVLAAYDFPPTLVGAVRYGCGHINDTYCVLCQPREGDCIRFILQGLSTAAFPHPDEVMDNFIRVTTYLKEQIQKLGGDAARETLSLIPTRDGKPYFTDSTGKVWRLMPFVEGTDCLQNATPELFAASARAFGRFQYLLRDFPAQTLHEPIRRFHDTEDRYQKFLLALRDDKAGRAQSADEEIRFAMSRRHDCSVALNAQREGKLPLRVTHNDTKLNNVLLDEKTGDGVCVIDLDTVMPGSLLYDFGDSIRFGASSAKEDETDLDKVYMDLEMFEVFVKGFLEELRPTMTEAEVLGLPMGAYLMTYETGVRFLGDYLNGDTYFKIHYPKHNLDRARNQLKLIADMDEKMPEMERIVRKYL